MTFELGRRLLARRALTRQGLCRALHATATEGVPLLRAVVSLGLVPASIVEEELGPHVLDVVVPDHALIEKLPIGLVSRLMAIPIGRHPLTDVVTVAVVDTDDPHPGREISYFLRAPTRYQRTTLQAMESALDGLFARLHPPRALAAPMASPVSQTLPMDRKAPKTPLWGSATDAPPSAVIPTNNPLARFSWAPSIANMVIEDPDEPVLELVLRADEPSRVRAKILAAQDRDEVTAWLLHGARLVARKAAIMTVRGDHFAGHDCTPTFGSEAAFRELRVPAAAPSALLTASMGGTYLGPLYASPSHTDLTEFMRAASFDVAITPVRALGHAVLLIIADELVDTMIGTRELEGFARAAEEALVRILRKRVSSRPPPER